MWCLRKAKIADLQRQVADLKELNNHVVLGLIGLKPSGFICIMVVPKITVPLNIRCRNTIHNPKWCHNFENDPYVGIYIPKMVS